MLGIVECDNITHCSFVGLMSTEQLLKLKLYSRKLLQSKSVTSIMFFIKKSMIGFRFSLIILAELARMFIPKLLIKFLRIFIREVSHRLKLWSNFNVRIVKSA